MEALAGRDVGEGFHFGNVVIGICRSSRGGGLLFLNRIILEMRHLKTRKSINKNNIPVFSQN